MERVNEFKEKITEIELKDFSERVRKLSDNKIDELWFMCGYIFSDHDKNFKALRKENIVEIRESADSAKEFLWESLLIETPLVDFKKNLEKIEHET